jgi:hypothetical protein
MVVVVAGMMVPMSVDPSQLMPGGGGGVYPHLPQPGGPGMPPLHGGYTPHPQAPLAFQAQSMQHGGMSQHTHGHGHSHSHGHGYMPMGPGRVPGPGPRPGPAGADGGRMLGGYNMVIDPDQPGPKIPRWVERGCGRADGRGCDFVDWTLVP